MHFFRQLCELQISIEKLQQKGLVVVSCNQMPVQSEGCKYMWVNCGINLTRCGHIYKIAIFIMWEMITKGNWFPVVYSDNGALLAPVVP